MKKKTSLSFILTLCLAFDASAIEIIVPAYFYPSSDPSLSYWDDMTGALSQVGITAIMNPNSGPSSATNSDYSAAINMFRAEGGKVIGYVHTNYGAQPLASVLAEIASYASFYKIDGIFLDEMSTNQADLAYYQAIYNSIKANQAGYIVFGNAGTNTLESYLGVADVLITFENKTGYSAYITDVWTKNYTAEHFAHLLYGVSSESDMLTSLALAADRNVGYIYVTDDVLPNPWDTLPTYWGAQVLALSNRMEQIRSEHMLSRLGFVPGTTRNWAPAASNAPAVVMKSGNGEAIRYTSANGAQTVANWIKAAGVSLPVGWTLQEAIKVNGNGNVLVGNAVDTAGNSHAWLARVDAVGSGFLSNISAFNNTLNEADALATQSGANLANIALFGAHHRSILDNGLVRTGENGACAWTTMDKANHNSNDTSFDLAEFGVCKDIGAARLGLSLGQAWSNQDLSLEGSVRHKGQYLLAEGANAFANGLEVSLTGYYGRFDTNIQRNYISGTSVDSSKADANTNVYAARIRTDWKNVAEIGSLNISPYVSYTWMESKLDSYTETGGGFPAHFAASKWRNQDIRLGITGKMSITNSSDLRIGAEAAHRIETNISGVNSQVIGLWHFSTPEQSNHQSWVRVTADVDHRLTNDLALTIGANAASSGGDANWGITAGLHANF